jgi:hypothetical protein
MRDVAFVSRSLHEPEKNYNVQEKEALGVVHAVKIPTLHTMLKFSNTFDD